MTKTVVTIIVGIVLSLGLLIGGFIALGFISYNQVKQEGTEMVETFSEDEVPEPSETVEPAEPEVEETLDSLPNADAEAAKWNEAAPDFIAENSGYKMDAANIKKDEANSSEAVTMFFHDFKTQLKTSINYTVDNDTQEITEMKLVGHEIAGADRAAIFYAMSIFISYVDGEVTMDQGGEYLGEIPFATNEAGVYEKEFNGKQYEYILDLNKGTNTLLYRVGE